MCHLHICRFHEFYLGRSALSRSGWQTRRHQQGLRYDKTSTSPNPETLFSGDLRRWCPPWCCDVGRPPNEAAWFSAVADDIRDPAIFGAFRPSFKALLTLPCQPLSGLIGASFYRCFPGLLEIVVLRIVSWYRPLDPPWPTPDIWQFCWPNMISLIDKVGRWQPNLGAHLHLFPKHTNHTDRNLANFCYDLLSRSACRYGDAAAPADMVMVMQLQKSESCNRVDLHALPRYDSSHLWSVWSEQKDTGQHKAGHKGVNIKQDIGVIGPISRHN